MYKSPKLHNHDRERLHLLGVKEKLGDPGVDEDFCLSESKTWVCCGIGGKQVKKY